MRIITLPKMHIAHRVCLMASTGAILLLNSCKDETSQAKVKMLEAELTQNNELVTKNKQETRRVATQLETIQRENAEIKLLIPKLQQEVEEKTKALDTLKKEFDAYKLKYKVSMAKRVPGLQVADFSANGRAYRNVILTEMNDSQINFSHSAGLGKLDLNALPETLRDTLGLNIAAAPVENVTYSNPAQEQDAAWYGQQKIVTDAEIELSSLHGDYEKLKQKIHDTQTLLERNREEHKPIANLRTSLTNFDRDLAKLKSQLASSEVKVFEARAVLSRMHPPKR